MCRRVKYNIGTVFIHNAVHFLIIANRRNFNRHLVADFTFYTVRTVFVYIDNYDFFRIEF